MNNNDILQHLSEVIGQRKQSDPDRSYVAHLFAKGDDAILKKIGEEATEVVMAAKDARASGECARLAGEVADLWFHCLVMLSAFDLTPAHVLTELERRTHMSGLAEKAGRRPDTLSVE